MIDVIDLLFGIFGICVDTIIQRFVPELCLSARICIMSTLLVTQKVITEWIRHIEQK